ncbi:MAG: hypothetical protein IPH16_01700 [Haliscomenobacter sp.]|nr:hypothetical protein [Haliscomenobacter sp.]
MVCAILRFFSNLEDIETPPYEAEFAFPLVNSSIAVKDVLEELDNLATLILVDSSGLLHFIYRGDLLTRTSEEIFGNISNALPPLIPILGNTMPIPLVLPNGVDLDRVDLKSGNFIFYAENPNLQPVNVLITIPELQREGQPFSIPFSIPAYSGSGARPSATNGSAPASLQGYSFLPDGDTVHIQVKALAPGNVQVNLQNTVVQFNQLAFSYAEGFLGKLIYEGEKDTVGIDFFETQYIQGDIRFADPRVAFHFENSLGIPTRAVVNAFDVFTIKGGKLQVESPVVQTGIDFPYPSLTEVGQTKTSTFVFTKANSNIDDLLNSGPTAVAYDVDAITHPDGNTAIRGLVTDKSFYRIQMEIDLPLEGQVDQFEAEREFNIDLKDLQDAQKVEFKMVTDNFIPLDLDLQAYFLDEDQVVLDSLLPKRDRLIKGAAFPSGQSQTSTFFVPFEGERLAKILKAQKLRVDAFFSTDTNKGRDIRIQSSQSLHFRLGARATVKIGG